MVMAELYSSLAIAIGLFAGFRYFGPGFRSQFQIAAPLSMVLMTASTTLRNGYFPEVWQLVAFLLLACGVPLSVYWLDRRFKLTHWEKDPD